MPESESEDEILDRIEEALRKIASASKAVRGPVAFNNAAETSLDREALAATLDTVIARLRGALASSQSPETE